MKYFNLISWLQNFCQDTELAFQQGKQVSEPRRRSMEAQVQWSIVDRIGSVWFDMFWPFLPEHSGPRIRRVGKFRRSRWTTSLAPCGPQDLEDLAETLSDLHDALRPWPGILGILPSCLFLSEGYSVFPMNPWNPWNPEPRSLDLGCERSKRVEMLMEPHWPLMLQHYRPTCRTPIFRYRTMLEGFVDDDWSRRDTETSNKCMIQLSWIVINACKCNSGWSLR